LLRTFFVSIFSQSTNSNLIMASNALPAGGVNDSPAVEGTGCLQNTNLDGTVEYDIDLDNELDELAGSSGPEDVVCQKGRRSARAIEQIEPVEPGPERSSGRKRREVNYNEGEGASAEVNKENTPFTKAPETLTTTAEDSQTAANVDDTSKADTSRRKSGRASRKSQKAQLAADQTDDHETPPARSTPATTSRRRPTRGSTLARSTTPPTRGPTSSTGARRRGAGGKKWEPTHLVTHPKSVLATAPLAQLLHAPRAWTCLTPAQQRALVAALPPAPSAAAAVDEAALVAAVPDGEPLPNVLRRRLASSAAFQTDVRQFQEDLAAGKLEPEWIEMATAASERRRLGEFDDWKVREREAMWGMKD
jgi:hypothetical protein